MNLSKNKEKEKELTYYLRGVEDNSVFEAELRYRINAAAAASLRYTFFFFLPALGVKKRKKNPVRLRLQRPSERVSERGATTVVWSSMTLESACDLGATASVNSSGTSAELPDETIVICLKQRREKTAVIPQSH